MPKCPTIMRKCTDDCPYTFDDDKMCKDCIRCDKHNMRPYGKYCSSTCEIHDIKEIIKNYEYLANYFKGHLKIVKCIHKKYGNNVVSDADSYDSDSNEFTCKK